MKYEYIIRKGVTTYALPHIYKWIPDGVKELSLYEIYKLTGKQFKNFPKEFRVTK